MDFDELRAFCTLAEDGNYRVASEHLCITQSALTKKIQRLEASSEVSLFLRGRQGTKLTVAGLTLLPEAKSLVAKFKSYEALTKLVAKGITGYLNIGFGISSYHLAPQFIAQFKQMYPNIHIELNDIPSHKQSEALLLGELQLCFSRLPVLPPLKGIKLSTDYLAIAVHRSRFVDKSNLWSSLENMDYLRLNPDRGIGLTQQIEALLSEHDKILTHAQQANDIQTLLALVSANLGFTIVPESARQIANENVDFVALNGVQSSWDIGLIWNDDFQSSAKDNFIKFVSKEIL
ncbi:LysR family transcriptional regulator [Vibrio neptunius]|uniref:LysR family transcriptional regulator n=1 Tax=Vibrio neptunius TaxID=170651 RepID=A0ABS3A7Q2_9VIBR|nr:LysR family transcriptional regulator [Vibrio neptunius]MBN3495823.1 LysR family transcriptional regulator [Vibrio neptunius]MBN3518238.1 LysR family transcriptional regulator [Vibrio neptunius]MBN3552575.1 LysR family transcriptional regulator [Vibrio neptunius]MBN3580506.1 LysR family transcriptional regulator [Vibrio neptunius]MCH9874173.1 LysR family transcriptional regulator [Vibrio neptunius]